ncbi:hypothetical protein FRC14_000127 [Serendipita sp. 396]|nr:hypothetical protein FRC14_000127 [Serendipita sp. 396]KAG8804179.1 hypothetical protein FRC16_000119 [Serendipita sp. 398]
MSVGPSRTKADNISWNNRILSVMDWCLPHESPFVKEMTLQLVKQYYQHFGVVVNMLPWSTPKKAHFYIEFATPKQALLAINFPPPDPHIIKFLIKHDKQHRQRFMTLASSNPRYAPYDPAHRQHPNGAFDEPALETSYIDWSREEPRADPEPGEILPSYYSPSPTLTVPIMGEKVRIPANNSATPAAVSALLAATSRSSPPPITPSPLASSEAPSYLYVVLQAHYMKVSSEQTMESTLDALSELRDQKANTMDASSPDEVISRHRINPNFDFEHHVLSGRFLRGTPPSDNEQDHRYFKLSPLQSYFASIYGSLQSELHENKRKQRQRLLELEEQKTKSRRLADELADERIARRGAERKVVDLQRQLEQAKAKAVEQTSAIHLYRADLKEATDRADTLHRCLKVIKKECERTLNNTSSELPGPG